MWVLAAVQIVCPLLFFTDLTRNPYFTQIALLYAGLALALGWFILDALWKGQCRLAINPVFWPVLAFFALALFSWAYSGLAHPFFRLPIWNEGLRVSLFLWINAGAAFFLAAQADPSWDGRFRWLILIVGALAAGYGVMQYLGHEFIWSQALNPYSGRPVSTFGNPNFLSSYLIMLLPVSLAEGASARGTGKKIVCMIFFWVYAAAIICTSTRSSWIGGAAALIVFVWFGRRALMARKAWLGVVLGVAVVMALLWPGSPSTGDTMKPLVRVRELAAGVAGKQVYQSWHQRILIWSSAWDMVKERPLIGKGWGCFELFYPYYQGWYLSDRIFRGFRTHANNAHNLILEFWSQTGTLGLGVFLWICFFFAALAVKRVPALPEDRRLEGWALLAAGVGMLVDNFFGNVSIFFAVPAFLFFWLMGRLAGLTSENRVLPARSPWVLAAGGFLIIACAAVAVRFYMHWHAETDYFAGFKKAKQGDIQGAIPLLERARDYRRYEVNSNYELANAYARQARWAQDNQLSRQAVELLEKADQAYGEALAANAGYDEIFFNRAAVLAQQKKDGEALFHYRMALLINPLSMEAYKALGNMYLPNQDRAQDAADLFERAVFYYPRDKDLWNNLGYLYNNMKENEKALNAFAKALALDVRFDVAWRNLRVAMVNTKRQDHPLLRVPGLWNQVQELVAREKFAQASPLVQEIVTLVPENLDARMLLGNVAARAADLATAEKSYHQVLEWVPGHWEARVNLGKVLAAQNRRDEARALFQELSAEKPQDQEVAGLLNSLKF